MRLGLFLAVLLAGGCSKKEAEPSENTPATPAQAVPKISEIEATRGRDACASFAKKACACASASPDNKELADQCEMATARPEALELNLKISATKAKMPSKDRWSTVQAARKIMAACIQGDLKFSCP